ncbi:MAG TPA: hypothetical protein VJ997_09260 [Longimicrobiales bacterium]|nr:hypothetical protein [Longimicrobiales bacterium]
MGAYSAAAGATLSLLGDAADYISASKRADKLGKISAKRYASVVANNNRQFTRSAQDIRTRTTEERSQIAAEVEGLVASILSTSGAVTAAAGAGGVAGVSVGDVRSDIERQGADQRAGISILQRFRERAAQRSIDSARIQTNLQNIAALPAPIVKPDLLTAIFAGAGNALSAYNSGGGGANTSAGGTVKADG